MTPLGGEHERAEMGDRVDGRKVQRSVEMEDYEG